jgi:ribosome maturation protein SDO1
VQANEVIRQLKESIPIERAQMQVRIVLPRNCSPKAIKPLILPSVTVQEEDWDDGNLEMLCTMDPGQYRVVSELVTSKTKGQGAVEITSVTTVAADDVAL